MGTFLNILVAGVLLGGIYSLVSIGLNLVFGVLRVVNFAHGAVVMVALYATYFCYAALSLDPYVAVFLVAPVMFVFGMGIYRFILRPLQGEPMMQTFATFGLLIVLQNAVLAITRGEPYSMNTEMSRLVFSVGPLNVSAVRALSLVVATVIAGALAAGLQYTLTGKAIRALIQDRQVGVLMGINVRRMYMLCVGMSAALAGVAAALLAPIYSLSPGLGDDFILPAFAVVVLGGLGSTMGAYLGGLLVGIIEALAGYYIDPTLKQAVWFLVFIAVMILRPSGLMGRVGAEEVGLRGSA
jgi:branched-chain amino acid transport system permease protein